MNSLISYRDSYLCFYIRISLDEMRDLVLPYVTVTSGKPINDEGYFSYLDVVERVSRLFYFENPSYKQILLYR